MNWLANFNPAWITLAASLYVPYLVARLAHKNNLRLMQERWLGSFRSEISELVANCEKRYHLAASLASESGAENQLRGIDIDIMRCKVRIRMLFLEEHRTERKRFVDLVHGLASACGSVNQEHLASNLHDYYVVEQSLIEQVELLIERHVSEMKRNA